MASTLKRKGFPAIVYIIILMLPAVVLLPHAKQARELVRIDEYSFTRQAAEREAVFNLTFSIMFGTAMLWILMVIPLVAIRDALIRKDSMQPKTHPDTGESSGSGRC